MRSSFFSLKFESFRLRKAIKHILVQKALVSFCGMIDEMERKMSFYEGALQRTLCLSIKVLKYFHHCGYGELVRDSSSWFRFSTKNSDVSLQTTCREFCSFRRIEMELSFDFNRLPLTMQVHMHMHIFCDFFCVNIFIQYFHD